MPDVAHRPEERDGFGERRLRRRVITLKHARVAGAVLGRDRVHLESELEGGPSRPLEHLVRSIEVAQHRVEVAPQPGRVRAEHRVRGRGVPLELVDTFERLAYRSRSPQLPERAEPERIEFPPRIARTSDVPQRAT